MAKIVTSKSSGKKYVQLENSELTLTEQQLVRDAIEAHKIAATADKALRDAVLARAELQGHGFNQVYTTYGGAVKIGKSDKVQEAPKAKQAPQSLADMLASYAADGLDA